MLTDGSGPPTASITSPYSGCGSQNGIGYGAGAGSGCFSGGVMRSCGIGAPGLVYVEWD